LQNLLKVLGRVKREGQTEVIPAEDLVPGDVVSLESGDRVPADVRLLKTNNLTVDEAFLTGESTAAQKQTGCLPEETPVSDRANMTFAGSAVLTGRGMGLVVGTGVRTEVGRIARSLAEVESAKPPLLIRMERLAHQIGGGVLAFAVLLGALMVYREVPLRDAFFVIVAMAVSAIPEGLPVAMTVALSLVTTRMSRRKVVVRKLLAVESLGSCTTIASDKTGTLTVNQQTARLVVLPDGTRAKVSGEGYNDAGAVLREGGAALDAALGARLRELAQVGVICNEGTLWRGPEGWRYAGDSMDVALLALGNKLSISAAEERRRNTVTAEIPFESENRYAAVAYQAADGIHIVAKGALEAIAPFCARMRVASGDVPLSYDALRRQAEEMARDGYRVLAFAKVTLGPGQRLDGFSPSHLANMVALGLVGFIDPLRPEAKAAVARAREAGVRVVMVTGDHPATALAIAKELGIAAEASEVLTGAEMAEALALDTPEFHLRLSHTRVFARVTPQQKLDIVDALMKLGEFVAVTGDGVNDAPALNRANIGVAMGSGTDVAKDAADLIVIDDNFASIVNGIEEGRYAYANVRKVILFLVSAGFAELLMVGATVLLGMPLPFLPVQLLWLNLVTNGIQDVALGFEAGEPEVMASPPRRPSQGIFDRSMIEQTLVGGITMALLCLGAWWSLTNSGMAEAQARSLVLALMIVLQFYHALNCRSERRSILRVPVRNNRVLFVGMAVAFGVHLLATLLPFTQSLLGLAPLSLDTWLTLGGMATLLIAVMEVYKLARRARPIAQRFG
jgi:magnesium-transporting ATPase (P-type)